MAKFGIVGAIPPDPPEKTLKTLVVDVMEFTHALYAILPRERWRQMYRTNEYRAMMESVREAERSLGVRSPRAEIVPCEEGKEK